jgi:hypothetical protein
VCRTLSKSSSFFERRYNQFAPPHRSKRRREQPVILWIVGEWGGYLVLSCFSSCSLVSHVAGDTHSHYVTTFHKDYLVFKLIFSRFSQSVSQSVSQSALEPLAHPAYPHRSLRVDGVLRRTGRLLLLHSRSSCSTTSLAHTVPAPALHCTGTRINSSPSSSSSSSSCSSTGNLVVAAAVAGRGLVPIR